MKQFIVRSAYRRLKFLGDEIEDRKNLFSGYEKDFMRVVRIARGNIKVNQNHEKLKQNLDEAAKHRARQQAEEALAPPSGGLGVRGEARLQRAW